MGADGGGRVYNGPTFSSPCQARVSSCNFVRLITI
jgi:hypothetical protein